MMRALLLAAAAGTFAAWAGPAPAADEQLALTLDDGRVLQATIRVPDAGPGKMPALMLFGGFRGAARVLEKVQAPRPIIWASFDYPFEPPRKFTFPGSLRHAPEARAAIHGSFEGIGKLYRALLAHPRVDPARITVAGASAGAPFATVGAARDPIPGVLLVQGNADVPRVIQNLIARKWRKTRGAWVETPAGWIAHWINWYCEIPDIAAEARKLRATQKVLMITATQDDFVPKPATEALWQALEASDALHERIDIEGIHLGVGDDTQRIADILDRSMRWMDKHDLL